jgi:hypothetical protein
MMPPWQRLLWALAYLYPINFLCAFYGAWLFAWATLGHMPRPMFDDPNSIGGLMPLVNLFIAIVFMAMPVLAPLGLVASFFLPLHPSNNWRVAMRCILAVIYVGLCFIALQIFWADPWRAVEWYAD